MLLLFPCLLLLLLQQQLLLQQLQCDSQAPPQRA
jgi:hypothetical protein